MKTHAEATAYALADPSGTITRLADGTTRDQAIQIGRANHDSGIALAELAEDGTWALMDLGGDWERPDLDPWEPPEDIDPLSAIPMEERLRAEADATARP